MGAITDAKGVLASSLGAPDEDPSDDHFADAGYAVLGMGLPTAAERGPECQYLKCARCVDVGQPMLLGDY